MRLITILLTLMPFLAFSQTEPPTQVFNGRLYEFKNTVRADSGLLLPRMDTMFHRQSLKAPGALLWRPADSSWYGFDGAKWVRISTGAAQLFASSGVYRDVDTLKLGGNYKITQLTGGDGDLLVIWHISDSTNSTAQSIWEQGVARMASTDGVHNTSILTAAQNYGLGQARGVYLSWDDVVAKLDSAGLRIGVGGLNANKEIVSPQFIFSALDSTVRWYRYKNNTLRDSVLSTDSAGNILLARLKTSSILGLQDSLNDRYRKPQVDDLFAQQTLQKVTTTGNSTNVNIIANGGIDVSSGNLLLGRGAGTSRIRSNRFIDMYGNSAGVDNGALLGFYRSDGLRTGAIGDGSSWDHNMYISASNGVNLRVTTTSGNGTSGSPEPYHIPFAISGYADSSRVLVQDSLPSSLMSAENRMSIKTNPLVYNTQNKAPVIEFVDGNYPKLRVATGMQGQPEWNASVNMYYYNRVHKYYDSTYNAIWAALSPVSAAFAIQYAPKGLPHSTSPSYDIWNVSGNRYLFKVDTTSAHFWVPANSFGFQIHRGLSTMNQGFSMDVGGGRTIFNSYDSTNAVYADYEFRSTKGSANKVLMVMDGDSGNTGHLTSSPTATLDLNGGTGYNQLRLRTTYTPTSSADANGNTGDISWDANYIYIKTAAGWKRAALTTF